VRIQNLTISASSSKFIVHQMHDFKEKFQTIDELKARITAMLTNISEITFVGYFNGK